MIFEKPINSSPVWANGHLYFCEGEGSTYVLQPSSEKFIQVAENKLSEKINASPAVVKNRIYIRTEKSLYCLENQEE